MRSIGALLFSLIAPELGHGVAMDAYVWILVIEIFTDWRNESSRTRGLTEAACRVLVQEVQSRTTRAYCYRDGEPDPEPRLRPVELRRFVPNAARCQGAGGSNGTLHA
jgi:hypothetical protein